MYYVSLEYKIAGKANFSLDDVLDKIAGKRSCASGALLTVPMIRDKTWNYRTKNKADQIAQQLKCVKGVQKVKVRQN
jgi:hypothetical protein